MAAQASPTLDVRSRAAWRSWLEKHHASSTDVWLVFHKRHTAIHSIDYENSVEEARDVPEYMERALKRDGAAWRCFEQLAPSYRRAYIGWIASAKRAETKERRLREAVGRLAKGEKLGLK